MTARSPGRPAATSASRVSWRSSGRARASRSIGGPERLERRPQLDGHDDVDREPGGRFDVRLRAGVPDRPDQVDQRPDLGLGARRRARRPRASARRSAGPGRSPGAAGAAHSASVTNGMTGWSSRRYVSRTSTSVHQVASRASGARSLVGQVGPWPARGPSRSTRSRSRRTGAGSPRRTRSRPSPRRRPRPSPRPATEASARPGPRWRTSGSRRSASSGIVAGRAPDDEPRRVPELVGEVAGVLELGRAEALVVAGRRAVDDARSGGRRHRTRRSRRAGRRRCPSSSTSSGRPGRG